MFNPIFINKSYKIIYKQRKRRCFRRRSEDSGEMIPRADEIHHSKAGYIIKTGEVFVKCDGLDVGHMAELSPQVHHLHVYIRDIKKEAKKKKIHIEGTFQVPKH